ncbi:MAG TPA: peptidylprolyl isomerase [Chitinophagaceae bacterium]|nr:peptidylprolyl isomerase [Chitinophagaceae bacterium]
MKVLFLIACVLLLADFSFAQQDVKLKKKDRKRDVELLTTHGTIVLRLSDSTPLHRDNFLRLVKSNYYDSLLFHRVIQKFMIQSGDPDSKQAEAGKALGNGGLGYTVPAEFRKSLFHRKGVLAAARQGDNVNPQKASSSTQFYIVQGRMFTDKEMDSVEIRRLQGYKLLPEHREVYKTIGGTPQLDQNYTVFGEVVRGLEVVDSIAAESTSRVPPDRPVKDVRIIKARLIKRR